MPKTSVGLEENIAGLLCYVLGWLTGIVFLVLEKENKFVRIDAIQSLATFLPLSIIAWVIGLIPFIGGVISSLIWILTLILWLILMFKAYKGEMYKLPVVGDFAEAHTQ
ncbi:MAG: putative membrane protein [Candidatus Methanocomedens sp.]|nr:MAG: putative membrane protein [ANME-2 cluster archaeon]